MPPRPQAAPESFADLKFPQNGLDVSTGYNNQRAGTTPLGINVRTYEPTTNRDRGGSRPGLSKYVSGQLPGGSALVQELATLVGVGYSQPASGGQSSTSDRIVTLVAVQGGNVYVAAPGGSIWTKATINTSSNPPLITSGVVLSAANNQKLWFADGVHQCYYDPSVNTVLPWVASQGSLPTDPLGNTPRLICTWRGRTVQSGLPNDPQNWFMSAVSDPTNWNYSPTAGGVPTTTPSQAIAGNNSPLGLIGDVVTCLIPYTDDVLLVGGDHTIYQMNGDPMAGGQIDLVTDAIGMAWGAPWCKGPDGTVYFVSNRTGIYSMVPGNAAPTRISQQIEALLLPLNTGSNTIRLVWDDRFQGLHVFISPTAAAGSATHFFWEQRAGAWWEDQFANNNLNPLCLCVFDGNTPGDRVPIIGSWDGYARAIDPTATSDDGTNISSKVMIGPFLTRDFDDILVKDCQAILGVSSGAVSYNFYIGTTAEQALLNTPNPTGTWNAGRNASNLVRRAGHAVYVGISSTNSWQMEEVRLRIAGKGKVRRRGKY